MTTEQQRLYSFSLQHILFSIFVVEFIDFDSNKYLSVFFSNLLFYVEFMFFCMDLHIPKCFIQFV